MSFPDLQAGDILFEGDVQIVNQIQHSAIGAPVDGGRIDGGRLEGAQGAVNVAVEEGTAEAGTILYHGNVPVMNQIQDTAFEADGVGGEGQNSGRLIIDEGVGSAGNTNDLNNGVTINNGDITSDPFWIKKFLKVIIILDCISLQI